jgi:hypothetical protein
VGIRPLVSLSALLQDAASAAYLGRGVRGKRCSFVTRDVRVNGPEEAAEPRPYAVACLWRHAVCVKS